MYIYIVLQENFMVDNINICLKLMYKTTTVNEWSESYFKTLEMAKVTDCKIINFFSVNWIFKCLGSFT